MKTFKQYISESVRVGLPHLYSTKTAKGNDTPSLSPEQFEHTTKGGKVHINSVTEKTDGQTFKAGHDEHGFYTQHSGSGDEKIVRLKVTSIVLSAELKRLVKNTALRLQKPSLSSMRLFTKMRAYKSTLLTRSNVLVKK